MMKRSDSRLRRRLTLSHDGRSFLERWGIVHERHGGFYLHHITGPDPGMDLHNHPWSFVSIVLWGGYTEQAASTSEAVDCARFAEEYPGSCTAGVERSFRMFSAHRMPLSSAHRITHTRRGTWTLVLRGPTQRRWGFYMPSGYVDWEQYPYDVRRPVSAQQR